MRQYEDDEIKIEVMEGGRYLGGYIVTQWHKNFSLEVDREVGEYETFGGAMDKAFEWLSEHTEATIRFLKDRR